MSFPTLNDSTLVDNLYGPVFLLLRMLSVHGHNNYSSLQFFCVIHQHLEKKFYPGPLWPFFAGTQKHITPENSQAPNAHEI